MYSAFFLGPLRRIRVLCCLAGLGRPEWEGSYAAVGAFAEHILHEYHVAVDLFLGHQLEDNK